MGYVTIGTPPAAPADEPLAHQRFGAVVAAFPKQVSADAVTTVLVPVLIAAALEQQSRPFSPVPMGPHGQNTDLVLAVVAQLRANQANLSLATALATAYAVMSD
jgi:hypothetical protein